MEKTQVAAGFPTSRLTLRKWFRLGIGFWLLAWLVSVCCYQSFDLNVKGCRTLCIGIGAGAVACMVGSEPVTFTHLGVRDHELIWADGTMKRMRQRSGLMAVMARGGWHHVHGATYVAFPMAGLLWLWLAAGWAAEIKRRRLSKASVDGKLSGTRRPSGKLLGLTALLIALGLATPYLVMRGRQDSEMWECFLCRRNIQQAIRGHCSVRQLQIGAAIRWDEIIGIGRYLPDTCRKCPSGTDYQLSPVVPQVGEIAAICPNAEHQRYFFSQDTSEW